MVPQPRNQQLSTSTTSSSQTKRSPTNRTNLSPIPHSSSLNNTTTTAVEKKDKKEKERTNTNTLPVPPKKNMTHWPEFENFTHDSLAVYVGNISPDIDPKAFGIMMEKCGRLGETIKWHRSVNFMSGKYRDFGFCECPHPECALRLKRVMNGMKIKGRPLVVKLLDRTRCTIEEYEKKLSEEHFKSREESDKYTTNKIKRTLGPLLDENGGGASGGGGDDASKDDAKNNSVNQEIEKFHERQDLYSMESIHENRKYLIRVLDDMIRDDENVRRQKRAKILGVKDHEKNEEDQNEKNKNDNQKVMLSESVFETQEAQKEVVRFGMPTMKKSDNVMTKTRIQGSVFKNSDDDVLEQRVDELGRVVRDVVPLSYTEEEKRVSVEEQAAAIAAKFKKEQELRVMSAKKLFARRVDWDNLREIDLKFREWISSQIERYLGESEDSLVNFIMEKILEKSDPKPIIEELEMVLEDDAETLVCDLWRRLHLSAMGIDI